MCFIDGDAVQLALLVDGGQKFAKVLRCAQFGGDVDETGIWMAALQVVFDALPFSIRGG